jgi:site-specific DNA-methyltransferase (adenine-specific)
MPKTNKSLISNVKTIDCIEMMKSMKQGSIDVVVTSPPYNIGIAYGKYMDRMAQDAYLEWCRAWAKQIARILHPEGSLFLNLGSAPSNPTIPHELLLNFVKKEHGGLGGSFVLQNHFHWIKAITIEDDEGNEFSKGHFKPINSHRFVTDCHESIYHLTHDGNVRIDRLAVGVKYKDKSNISRWKHTEGRDVRCRGNTWFIPYSTIQSRKDQRNHPAPFPPELPEMCIRIHGARPNLRVFDPFLGIGNSWTAAIRTKVGHFYGCDVDKTYVAEARRRIKILNSNNHAE